MTDSPDFHLRLARRLKELEIPVIYLVAPQAWAWRKGRLPAMRRTIDRLLCIFPFEQDFFTSNGIGAVYVGHPLTRLVKASASREELRRRYGSCRRQTVGRACFRGAGGARRPGTCRLCSKLSQRIVAASVGPAPQFILATPPGTFPAGLKI